jgi:hypothetical protein
LSLPSLDLPERLLITRMANELPRRVCTFDTVKLVSWSDID